MRIGLRHQLVYFLFSHKSSALCMCMCFPLPLRLLGSVFGVPARAPVLVLCAVCSMWAICVSNRMLGLGLGSRPPAPPPPPGPGPGTPLRAPRRCRPLGLACWGRGLRGSVRSNFAYFQTCVFAASHRARQAYATDLAFGTRTDKVLN